MDLRLSAAETEAVIHGGLPAAAKSGLKVEEVRSGYARVRLPFNPWMLRAGNVISGPTLFTAADSAMYACVLAHIGAQVMALTANLTINFLNPGSAGDVVAEAKLLRLGQRMAVLEVSVFTADEPTLVAHVTGSYALPARR